MSGLIAFPTTPQPNRQLRLPGHREDCGDALSTRAWLVAEAAATPDGRRANFARIIVASIVRRYWQGIGARSALGSLDSDGELGAAFFDATESLGRYASDLDAVEATAFLGELYASLLPPSHRTKNGVFYTPLPVARHLLARVDDAGVDWSAARVLDPAAGAGIFLVLAANRMLGALEGTDRKIAARSVCRRLRGRELDPFAAWLCETFVRALLWQRAGMSQALETPICVGDSLVEPTDGQFDLVVGNPPYGRVTLPREAREKFSATLFGHANLYGLFLHLGVMEAKSEGGVVAYVTPTSFLSGEYFKNLRTYLGENARPRSLSLVHQRTGVFDGVMQETLLGVFQRGGRTRAPLLEFVQSGTQTTSVERGGQCPIDYSEGRPWIVPRSREGLSVASGLRRFQARLADWGYEVRTGPLVWNRHKGNLRERPSKNTVPLIWAESVDVDGVFCFRAARRNHLPYFAIGPSDEWLVVSEPCVLLQRTTSKEQARRLIAAELPKAFLREHGSVTVENHLNMLVPISSDPVPPATLSAFLNSTAADQVFRCLNGSVAVSAYELESMPLPARHDLKDLDKAVRGGASRAAIDRIALALYS